LEAAPAWEAFPYLKEEGDHEAIQEEELVVVVSKIKKNTLLGEKSMNHK